MESLLVMGDDHDFEIPVMAATAVSDREAYEANERAMRKSFRRKMIVAVLIGVVSTGASVMSCAGQSFSYRQARALEDIATKIGGCK